MTPEGLVLTDPSELPVIDKYQVVRKLASGGMGDVFLARQLGPVAFNRLVVLKALHADLLADQDFVTMFLNEAQLIANLGHPNIIHIYELIQDQGGYVIAMEYVKGGSVLDLLREHRRHERRGLPFGPALRIATSVSDALHYAYHERGPDDAPLRIIHRDVSPSNILVGLDGQIKLVDFGIAKALAAEPLTKTTTIKGKSGYLAPEQIRTQPLDHRCDVFALGVVLWEMTVGARLFRRDNDLQTMNAILHEPYPRPSERVPDYPRALEEIVMTAIARDRDERYRDAASLANDLRGLARDRDWDLEASGLARLVDELIDVDQISIEPDGTGRSPRGSTPGRGGTRSLAGAPARADVGLAGAARSRPATAMGTGASLAVADSGAAGAAHAHGGMPWTTIIVMLMLSAVFWLLIVPRL